MLCNINKTWLKCLLFSVQLPLLPSLPLTNTQTCTHLNILLYIDVSHLNHYQILIVDNMVFNILFITTCQFSNRYISNSIISWLWWCEHFFFKSPSVYISEMRLFSLHTSDCCTHLCSHIDGVSVVVCSSLLQINGISNWTHYSSLAKSFQISIIW